MNLTIISLAMAQYKSRLQSLKMAWQLVKKKESSEFKTFETQLKQLT